MTMQPMETASVMSERQPSKAAGVQLPIYMDYHATTPVDARVLAAMLPYFSEKFGNPHSVSHVFGWEAEEAVERGREQVAALIGADPKEIVFTSGATESNNLAIKGAARFYKAKRNHVVTAATEHKCVIESCKRLEREGFEVTVLPVQRNGLVDLETVRRAVSERTVLVSIMAANNEIGVLQPIAEIGAICRERGALLHTDAAQAVGKVPLDVKAMNIDLMSISGHKIFGPKGIGVLYLRRRPRVRLDPLMDGGGQERGCRSGTVPAPLVVGIGKACAIYAAEGEEESRRLRVLRDRLFRRITENLEGVILNGDPAQRLSNNLNLSFEGLAPGALLAALKDIALSSGSACTSAAVEPSYVLRALGVPDELANTSIRFGLGRPTTEAEVDYVADRVIAEAKRLRQAGAAARRAAP